MAEWFKKNKNKVLITAIITVLLTSAILLGIKLYGNETGGNVNDPTDKDTFTKYEFQHEAYERQGTLPDPDDVGVWISNCDAPSSFKSSSGTLFTSYNNTYVQGTGALNLVNIKYTSMMVYGTFEPVDISNYKSFHISLYVNDPKYLGEKNITLELTSSGQYDVEEIAWGISPSKLKAGWNDLYLDMNAASVMPTADLTKMCYFRIYCSGAGVGMRAYLDSMYMTNTEPNYVKEPEKLASTREGYILDFDSLEGLFSSGKLTLVTDKNKCKDGAAVQIENPTDVWIRTKLQTIDLSGYKEGKFKLWLYVNDASLLTKDSGMTIELTSSGEADKNEISWSFGISHLKTGWNELNLSFASANKSSKEEIDWTKVDFLRIYGLKCDAKLVFTIDGGKLWAPQTIVPADGMIISGETMEDYANASGAELTTAQGEYKQGNSALKKTVSHIEWMRVVLNNRVDVSKFADGGLHVWLYVDDVKQLAGAVTIEISSSGTSDEEEYQWTVSGLSDGWNELLLPFEKASVKGVPDLKAIDYFRVFGEIKGEITVIVDDVRAVADAGEKVPEGTTNDSEVDGMIFSGDSMLYADIYSGYSNKITREAGEYLQGSGAFKMIGAGGPDRIRLQAKLKETKDISAYKAGGIQLSIYIENKAEFVSTAMTMELTSSGQPDVDEAGWRIDIAELKEGWNTVVLPFVEANILGKFDYEAVNFLRMYMNAVETSTDIIMIVDDVHAIAELPKDEGDEQEPEAGLILDCDKTKGMSVGADNPVGVTQKQGMYQQGTGAFTGTGTGVVWLEVRMGTPVDISEYADGNLTFMLYVSDASLVDGSKMRVQLGSEGSYDGARYNWNMNDVTLEDGWNQVTLDLGKTPIGTVDLSHINYFRIFQNGGQSAALTYVIDDVRAVEKPAVELPDDVADVVDFIVDVEAGRDVKVLQLTDTQIVDAAQQRYEGRLGDGETALWATNRMEQNCFSYIRETVKETNPDLIIITGDVIYGEYDDDGSVWMRFIEFMESLRIPWAPVFGNHENESTMGVDWQCQQLEAAEYCLFKQRELTGNGNYTVGISQGGELKRVFFMLDSNGCGNLSDKSKENGHTTSEVGFGQDQITWYTEVAKQIKGVSPETKLSFAFHIQLQAFADAYEKYGFNNTDTKENPINIDILDEVNDGDFGYLGRNLKGAWDQNDVIITGLKRLGVDSIFVGHEHCNSASVVHEGIRYQFGQKSSNYDRTNYLKSDGTIVGDTGYRGKPMIGGTVMSLDGEDGSIQDAYIYLAKQNDVVVAGDGMLFDCDDRDSVLVGDIYSAVTNFNGEYKEGDGAIKRTTKGTVWWQIVLEQSKDVSAYENGGLHLWLYVEDKSLLTSNVTVELGSNFSYDYSEFEWTVSKSSLQNGWNELYLEFDNASVNRGGANLSYINHLRIFAGTSAEMTVILDDVRAVDESVPEPNLPKQWTVLNEAVTIPNASNRTWELKNLNVNIGKTDEELDEVALYIRLNVKQDVYRNLTNNAVCFKVEMAKETTDYSEFEWTVPFDDIPLQAGEVVLILPWNEAEQKSKDNAASTIEKTLNYFRLFTNAADGSAPWNVLEGLVVEEIKVVSVQKEWSVLNEAVKIPNASNRTWELNNLNVNIDKTDDELDEIALYIRLNIEQVVYNNLTNKAVSFTVEMAKEKCDYNEFEWTVPFDDISLQTGEVILTLPWNEAEQKCKDGGASTIEEALNYFRLYTHAADGSAPWNVLEGLVVEEIKIVETTTK